MQVDHYKCVMDMAVIAWLESKVGEILSDYIRMRTESGSPPWREMCLIFIKLINTTINGPQKYNLFWYIFINSNSQALDWIGLYLNSNAEKNLSD